MSSPSIRQILTSLSLTMLGTVSPAISAWSQEQAIQVDANGLERRSDLVGRLIVVDDRLRFYVFHQGRGYDELKLKRTNLSFRLPPPLKPESPPRPSPVLVQGKLRQEGDQILCDVVAVKVLPPDLDRLNQAVSALPPRDFENRKAWAAWAEKRGKDFDDAPLTQRAAAVRAEALRIEADQSRGAVDAPREWLRMAEDARKRKIAEPEPSALAHRAFRASLARISSSQAARELVTAIEKFFPLAPRDTAAGNPQPDGVRQSEPEESAEAYRRASAEGRKSLDHRLWADARQRELEFLVDEDPNSAIPLATAAERDLPERTEFSQDLLKQGLGQSTQNIGGLRLSEVRSIGDAYRGKLRDPEKALSLYRDWLKIQRDRLSPTDAEGAMDLAGLYEELLQDRTNTISLLEQAWKIDPSSEKVAEAFRSRGYRRSKDGWIEDSPQSTLMQGNTQGAREAPTGGRGLRGLTPEEVLGQLRSAPDRKVLIGTKGQMVEQWIFRLPTQRRWRFVNFIQSPGDLHPRAVSDYSLPETVFGKALTTGR